jgi:chromosome segregation ATPase
MSQVPFSNTINAVSQIVDELLEVILSEKRNVSDLKSRVQDLELRPMKRPPSPFAKSTKQDATASNLDQDLQDCENELSVLKTKLKNSQVSNTKLDKENTTQIQKIKELEDTIKYKTKTYNALVKKQSVSNVPTSKSVSTTVANKQKPVKEEYNQDDEEKERLQAEIINLQNLITTMNKQNQQNDSNNLHSLRIFDSLVTTYRGAPAGRKILETLDLYVSNQYTG